MCDGLGACVGHCPTGALSIETREADAYDEVAVIKEMIPKGKNLIIAHLAHLKDHNEIPLLREAMEYLRSEEDNLPFTVDEILDGLAASNKQSSCASGGCPGSMNQEIKPRARAQQEQASEIPNGSTASSALTQWPVQLHLINPAAGFFQGADLLMAADCVAFALGNFHQNYLQNKKLAIACPKLDSNMDVYVNKIKQLIDESKINTITVMVMEVPCCGGLLKIVEMAVAQATRKVPVKQLVCSIQGEIIEEKWV
jgi:ferredoxin